MGPTWVLTAPDGPHVGPMNLAIVITLYGDDDEEEVGTRVSSILPRKPLAVQSTQWGVNKITEILNAFS